MSSSSPRQSQQSQQQGRPPARAGRRRARSPTQSSSLPPTSSSPPPPRRARVVEEEEEEEGEELIHERLEEDYRAVPELDTYEAEGLGSDDVEEISGEARAAAEREMAERDRLERRRAGRLPAALTAEDEEAPRALRRRLSDGSEAKGEEAVEAEEEVYVNLEDIPGAARDWLLKSPVRHEVKRRFANFLRRFAERDATGERFVYNERISQMCATNKESLEVNYIHLSQSVPILAIWVADAPKQMLEILDEQAYESALVQFPQYGQVTDEIHVRITHLPVVDNLRELRQTHLNGLVKTTGVVTRRTSVYPQLKRVRFQCAKCNALTQYYMQNTEKEVQPGRCVECQSPGPFLVSAEQTVYRNYQKITLQESPGSVPAGRVPRQKDVILLHDLIDSCRPGEEIEVTGIYANSFDAALNVQNGFPVFRTVIEANYISKRQDEFETFALTDEDRRRIEALARSPDVAQRIFNSVAPSIYGHENIKIALALAMFGGETKILPNRHQLRGDINVLVLGDPGTGKSQFLKFVEKTAPRAVYTTGKGASAVGLTAAVRQDQVTREWTLEGGALVLADRGVCLIDEFDKMNDQDRTSIHEAMEQQSISISKAGIIATLQARCAVIAAANPLGGRYDSSLSFAENVDLTDAILSRFDVLCVVRDVVDPVMDEKLADFVVDSHVKAHPIYRSTHDKDDDAAERGQQQQQQQQQQSSQAQSQSQSQPQPRARGRGAAAAAAAGDDDGVGSDAAAPIPPDLLRKYIMHARSRYHPKLTSVDQDKIASLYVELRRESVGAGGIPITVRHIESIVRMSEAHAKLHLREFVRDDDVDMAIRVMLESFISTQKFAVMRNLRRHFSRYITYKRDAFELLLFVLRNMVKDQVSFRQIVGVTSPTEPIEVDLDEFLAKAQEMGVPDCNPFFRSNLFKANKFSIDRRKNAIVHKL